MNVSPEIRIGVSLRRGAVYLIDDVVPGGKHYFIVINDPGSAGRAVMLCATSQVGKAQLRVVKRNLPPSTIVRINVGSYPGFKEETAIDCNSFHDISKETLIEKLVKGSLIILTDQLDDKIIKQLVSGVKASPMVEEVVKNGL